MAALLNVHTVKIGTHVEPEGGGSPHPRALGGNPSFFSFRELDIFATPERDHILYVGLEFLQGGTPTNLTSANSLCHHISMPACI